MKLNFGNEWTDERGRVYRELLDPAEADALYAKDKKMWTTRGLPEGEEYPEDFKQRVIASQLADYNQPGFGTLAPLLERVVAEKRARGEIEISIIEMGAADGTTVRHFMNSFPDITLHFFGMEALGFLAEDAQRKYPSHRFVTGTAEDFVEFDAATFGRDRFDLFLVSGTLCMLLPDLVHRVLAKAGEITDCVLCRDYLANKSGEVSADRPVMFELAPRHHHILFANPYELILRELGFTEIEYVMEESDEAFVRGTGSFFAQRSA